MKYCNFATFNKIVDTQTSLIQIEPNTHGHKLRNTCNNVTTNFGLYISFIVKFSKNVLTICQNL